MSKVAFFIDGFNMYFAIADTRELCRYRWLDYPSLCRHFVPAKDELGDINFFTAFYPGSLTKRKRHEEYLRALRISGVNIILGEYKSRDRRFKGYCRNFDPTKVDPAKVFPRGYRCVRMYKATEEKQTDVNIAIQMLSYAVQARCDRIALISGDSDLAPAIRETQRLFPEIDISSL